MAYFFEIIELIAFKIFLICRYHGVIRTAEDLAHTNMKWGATSTAWIDSIMGETRVTILLHHLILKYTNCYTI